MYEPDFRQLEKVLKRERPDRPVLFELVLNERLYERLTADNPVDPSDPLFHWRRPIRAFMAAGYDYTIVRGSDFRFALGDRHKASSISLNEGAVITDRASFESHPWPDPASFDYSILDVLGEELIGGAKLIVWGPDGVLENVEKLVGYENLCLMLMDDPALAAEIFDAVGSRLVRYYELSAAHQTVGALMSNDDWGFKTQPMISPADLRRHVFPWHKRIVEAIHAAGKPAILHSCGQLQDVMDDVIDDMGFDAKHSFEDAICPVEDAYERWGGRIAIIGGIDVDFLTRSTPERIRQRSHSMLERTERRGGYALGSGNSVPAYVPDENYFAMIRAAADYCAT